MKARLITSALVMLAISLGVSGCTFFTYQATTEPFAPSDGVQTRVGALDIRNALVISQEGENGNLVMSVVNNGTTDVNLEVQYGSGTAKMTQYIPVKASSTLSLGDATTPPLLLPAIHTEPGALLPIYFQYGSTTGSEKLVPVLDAGLPAYRSLAPQITPSNPATVSPSATPQP